MQRISRLLLTLCVTVSSPAIAANADVIVACQQLGYDYAWHLDHPGEDLDASARDFASLFADGATLTLGNLQMQMETHRGSAEIAARYKQGRDRFRFLHLITNHRVQPTSDTTATGTSYVEFYIHPIGADMDHELGVMGVAEYRDTYEVSDGVCRFASREGVSRLLSVQNKISQPTSE